MTATFRLLVTLALFTLTGITHAADPSTQELLRDFPRTQLTIKTPDARAHRFDIWVATNDRHRMQGLMFVRSLPENAGMLFVYAEPRRISMWMKNTYIPLDMLFIRGDGRVMQVEANTTPHSLKSIESRDDVVAVLELNGGTAQRLNIRSGAIVSGVALERAANDSQ